MSWHALPAGEVWSRTDDNTSRGIHSLIESQFVENTNTKLYYFFNATRLNQSATAIDNAIEGEGVQPGYLIATLKWDNTTDPDPGVGVGGSSPGTSTSNSGGGSNPDTGLAMFVLADLLTFTQH